MKAILLLAVKSAWARRLTLAVTLVSIALSTALLLAVERIRVDARESFSQSVSGLDLVVGARTGAVQLMLYSVFHSGAASNNVEWKSYEALASHPAVDWAVPLSLGDSHRGYAVLGTSTDYFKHFRYGDKQALAFSGGGPWSQVFEAVLGSEVAEKLGYPLGHVIKLNHGMGSDKSGRVEHGDKPVTVVGILARTGTPVDRTVHVNLETLTALHLDWVAGAPVPGLSIPAQFVAKFDLRPKEITAMMLGLKQRSDVFRMQRFINEFRGEPLLAVMPGVALDELWQTLGMVEKSLLAVSTLVVIIGLAGLIAVMLASLNERRRELAILRALGAGPRDMFLMLTAEGVLITLVGAALGVALLAAATPLLAPLAQSQFGIVLQTRLLSPTELDLLGAVVFAGFLASLVPGARAWRLSLADGLTPRT
jgi:putative ABC transport system permease protein